MLEEFRNPLPGVPNVESPFFDKLFTPDTMDAETLRIATALNQDGFAVLDFPDPDFDIVAERLKAALAPQYDWNAWRSGALANLRIQDVWAVNNDALSLATNPHILALLGRLYGREPFPFQSLNFPVGTQQHYHSDSVHFSTMPERFMCGVWVALEDIGEDQGPLVYYPGSHKWPIYKGEHIGHTHAEILGTDQRHYDKMWEELVAVSGVEPKRFMAKKGQALIWAANLLHGGDVQKDKSKTRWSQVTHYYFKECAYYTPMHSDPVIGIVTYRQPFNLVTRGLERNYYNGELIPDTVLANASPYAPIHGWKTGLPTDFDPEAYLDFNPDVRAANMSPGDHFLKYGRTEGRKYVRA